MKLHQINDDDLETCEEAIEELGALVLSNGSPSEQEHFSMLRAAVKRVRDDYGPHTNVTVIPA